MPEVNEVSITAQYIAKKILGKKITDFKVLSGRYTHQKLNGLELLKYPLKIKNIDTKGKFLWFELLDHNDKTIYLMNTFGLTGSWSFEEDDNSRIMIEIDKKKYLYYDDPRNFGTFNFTDDEKVFNKKLNSLGPDLLKEEFTYSDLKKRFKSVKQNIPIIKILMDQTKKGIGSGIGNYLAPEILYNAKISPHRTAESLSSNDIKKIYNSIKYIIKLSYMDNNYFDLKFKGKKNFIPDVDVSNKKFNFNVYMQKTDPLGNTVKKDSIINDRTTYWVPNVQK